VSSDWDRDAPVGREEADRMRSERLRASVEPNTAPVESAKSKYPGASPVVVIDFQMSFGSMVWFMVKAAVAAIPALLILMVAFAVLTRGVGMLLGL